MGKINSSQFKTIHYGEVIQLVVTEYCKHIY